MGDWGTASDKHSIGRTTRLHTIAGVHAQVLHKILLHSHTQTEKLLNLLLVIPHISGLLGPLCEIMITLRPDQSFNSRSCAAKRSPDKDDKGKAQGCARQAPNTPESRWEPMRAAGETGSKMVKDGQSVPWPEESAEGAEGAASVERCSGPAVHCRSKRLGQAFAPAAKRLLLTGPGPEKFDTNPNSNPN